MPKRIESEKKLERLLTKLVKEELGGICIKLCAEYMNGLPDRMCVLPNGITFFVEVKTTGKKPEPIQVWWHERLRSLGFRVYVLDSQDVLHTILTDNLNTEIEL